MANESPQSNFTPVYQEPELPNSSQGDGQIDIDRLSNFIPTVNTTTTVLARIPRKFSEQFRIYASGSTYRFYWYDTLTHAWQYVTSPPSINKFGGDGSDGALTVTGGTTIDLANAKLVVKNYTSISHTGGTLTFSNPHTNGTVIILRSQGNVTVSSTIEASAFGASGNSTDGNGWGILDSLTTHSGKDGGDTGVGGTAFTLTPFYQSTKDGDYLYSRGLVLVPGCGGGNGGNNSGEGAGGGGSLEAVGGTGGRGVNSPGSAAGGTRAGGGGGAGAGGGTGGAGGRGGATLYIECGGALNFSGTINAKGQKPGSVSGGGAAGGGGAGGMVVVLYNSLTANSGTINTNGGAGGDVSGGGAGGAGGASASGLVAKNLWFS